MAWFGGSLFIARKRIPIGTPMYTVRRNKRTGEPSLYESTPTTVNTLRNGLPYIVTFTGVTNPMYTGVHRPPFQLAFRKEQHAKDWLAVLMYTARKYEG